MKSWDGYPYLIVGCADVYYNSLRVGILGVELFGIPRVFLPDASFSRAHTTFPWTHTTFPRTDTALSCVFSRTCFFGSFSRHFEN